MEACEHQVVEKKTVKETVLGKNFSFKAEVCSNCHAVLWTGVIQKDFDRWLFKLHEKEPNLFVMQPRLSKGAVEYLNKVNDLFKDHSRATIIRAIVYVFIDDIGQDPRFSKQAHKVKETAAYGHFSDGEKTPIRVRMKPSQVLDLLAWSKATGYAPAKVMEQAIVGFLSLFRENEKRKVDKDLKELTGMIHDVLRAA